MPEAAGQRAAEVGQDVGEQIGGDHHLERLRPQHEARRHRVDQPLLGLDARVLGATRRNTSSQSIMPYCWAFDLVTLVTFLRLRVSARSKAKRMIRSQPSSVKRPAWMAISLPGPRPAQIAPADAGVLALAVLAHHHPVHVLGASRCAAGSATPGSSRTGRMLAYWSKPWQIASRRPHRLMWSGTPGQPTAPK